MAKTPQFTASDEFIVWAHSLVGMLARIKGEYGGISDMVEHPDWDEGKTTYALHLLENLYEHVGSLKTELQIHVEEKTGKNPR